jgi:phosphoglycolate phosphatase
VLWDVDNTLISARGAGLRLYQAALRDMYGLELPRLPQTFAGRTDTAIALEVLDLAGVPEPAGQVKRFQAFLASRAGAIADDIREHGRVLPGAAETVAALAAGLNGQPVVQSLLTGNLPELARIKLGALNLTGHLDLTIGAYGDISADRADLVEVARARATARHGGDFSGRRTVLVGDTPDDVDAALRNGASVVAVASGEYSPADLVAAGAHTVLPSLADIASSVQAIRCAPAAGSQPG